MILYLATVVSVRDLATGIKLFQVRVDDPTVSADFDYQPGQFAEVSAFGIASTRERSEAIEFAINRVGTVTNALHRMDVGDVIGVRAPLGKGFPRDQFRGNDIAILGGGIGGAPLCPVIHTILGHGNDYLSWPSLGRLGHPTCRCSPTNTTTGEPDPIPSYT